jgi:hypothetical protein
MKNFWSLKELFKPKKAKTIIVKSGLFKGQRIYKYYKSNLKIDENCPFYKEKMEAAIRSVQECPIPEEVFRRAQGLE